MKKNLIHSKNKLVYNSYRLAKYWLPVLIWAGIIFLFSNRPTIKTIDFFLGDFILKKSAHFVEYGVFATLLYRGFINYGIDKKKTMILSVFIAFLYAISDEFHQSFIYGRTATLRDVLIDTFGAYFSVFIVIKHLKKLPNYIIDFYYRNEIDIITKKVDL